MEASGFEVTDVGVDVSPEKFVLKGTVGSNLTLSSIAFSIIFIKKLNTTLTAFKVHQRFIQPTTIRNYVYHK